MAYKSHIRSCICRKYQAIKTRKVLNQNLASIQYLVPPQLQGISSKTTRRCLKQRELLNFNSARNVAAASSWTDSLSNNFYVSQSKSIHYLVSSVSGDPLKFLCRLNAFWPKELPLFGTRFLCLPPANLMPFPSQLGTYHSQWLQLFQFEMQQNQHKFLFPSFHTCKICSYHITKQTQNTIFFLLS